MTAKILLVEDDAATRFGYGQFLSSMGYEIAEADSVAAATRQVARERFDAIIIDIKLPDGSGLDLIAAFRQESPEVAIIVITGAGDVPQAVEAMRRGADNFLVKPVDMQGLELFLQKNIEIGAMKKLHATRKRLRRKEEIWFGRSESMQQLADLLRIGAESEAPVLLTGETGTGKGVMAQWIHRHGKRASFGYVDINCSGLKRDLLARELFGNVRGAFTSADQDREGLLDAADRGTLFLDEIAEMDLSIQAQFLKVLEEKTYRRLGDTKLQKSDFRLISATNRCIEEDIRQGRFRQDLYYRLNILVIQVPPLRERKEDLPDLIRALLDNGNHSTTELTDEALQFLQTYAWPGNVRELKNVLERATLLAAGQCLTPEHFVWMQAAPLPSPALHRIRTLEELEREHILAVLALCNNDIPTTAQRLGISRATLYRRLKKFQVKSMEPPRPVSS